MPQTQSQSALAERCAYCGKRQAFLFGLKGFGLRQKNHEERCRNRQWRSVGSSVISRGTSEQCVLNDILQPNHRSGCNMASVVSSTRSDQSQQELVHGHSFKEGDRGVRVGDKVSVNNREGTVACDLRPEHDFVTVKWDDDGMESDVIRLDDVQLAKESYEIGELVAMRDAGGPWQRGYITSVDPLKVSFVYDGPHGSGYPWDEVRKEDDDAGSTVGSTRSSSSVVGYGKPWSLIRRSASVGSVGSTKSSSSVPEQRGRRTKPWKRLQRSASLSSVGTARSSSSVVKQQGRPSFWRLKRSDSSSSIGTVKSSSDPVDMQGRYNGATRTSADETTQRFNENHPLLQRSPSGTSMDETSQLDDAVLAQITRDSSKDISRPPTPASPDDNADSSAAHSPMAMIAVVFSWIAGIYASSGHGLSGDFASPEVFIEPIAQTVKVIAAPEVFAMPGSPPVGMILLAVLLLIWSVWEATKFPRHQSMGTVWDCIRMMVQLAGDLLLVPFFIAMPGEVTEVEYRPTPQNKQILAACPSMWRFKQTPWFRNGFVSFAALMYYDFTGYDESMVHREKLLTADGATIALDWFGAKKPGANNKKKVLLVASTWTGDSMNSFSREACKHFTAQGWQCVVVVKRGCGLIMPNVQETAVKPWCLTGFDDFQLAVDRVARLCPGVPICGLGPSLGATHLRNYVNSVGSKSKLKAVVCVDAGEDYTLAFDSLDRRLPLLSCVLVAAALKTFRVCGFAKPRGSKAQKDVPAAEGVAHKWLREWMAPAHGFESSSSGVAQYLRTCQPNDPAGCKIPALEILSFNDLLSDPASVQIQQKYHLASPHIVTCVTQLGTHVIRWNGLKGRCWLSQVSCEFLESALKEQGAAMARAG